VSVTFHVQMERGDVYGHRVECYACPWQGTPFDTYAKAEVDFTGHSRECPECGDFDSLHIAALSVIDGQPDVNMNNRNAADVLRLLGVDAAAEGWAGSFDPDDLIGRAMLGAIEPDEGLPEYHGPGVVLGALVENLHDLGREAGYIARRMAEVIEVAHAAKAFGRRVSWS
jgi:hypothetical protein